MASVSKSPRALLNAVQAKLNGDVNYYVEIHDIKQAIRAARDYAQKTMIFLKTHGKGLDSVQKFVLVQQAKSMLSRGLKMKEY